MSLIASAPCKIERVVDEATDAKLSSLMAVKGSERPALKRTRGASAPDVERADERAFAREGERLHGVVGKIANEDVPSILAYRAQDEAPIAKLRHGVEGTHYVRWPLAIIRVASSG